MATILIFGAGKSSTVLINDLMSHASSENYTIVVVDAQPGLAQEKVGDSSCATPLSFDISEADRRRGAIRSADIVISLLPPALHILVAKDCLSEGKHLLTASYVDGEIRDLADAISDRKLLFLYEMGLDPGIDHMSAMRIVDGIRAKSGRIRSFVSHCGGLVAPESDDNPWHYKISWNPRNLVMAGKAGARYRLGGQQIEESYQDLFARDRKATIAGSGEWGWYPNRDSTGYLSLYGLDDIPTFIRTTLRHRDFIFGWNNIIELNLTGEEKLYKTDGLSLMDFFREHMERNGFGRWLNQKLSDRFGTAKDMLQFLATIAEQEEQVPPDGSASPGDMMVVDGAGALNKLDADEVRGGAAAAMAEQMRQSNLILKQLFFLGMDDRATKLNLGQASAAEVLQFALEKKLPLAPKDHDMVLMQHEVEYELGGQDYKITSTLQAMGRNNRETAMATTVGMPLSVGARLLARGLLPVRGLCVPTLASIYVPILHDLELAGIVFIEQESHIK